MTAIAETKATPTDHEIHPLIEHRWSPRAFKSDPVAPAKLAQLFEAARWAASASNLQPWRYLVAQQGDAAFEKLFESLAEGNKAWNRHVPVLVASFTDPVIPAKGDKPAQPNATAQHDLGMANANLAAQATALGLHVHFMAGFDKDRVKTSLDVPEPYEPVALISVGYLASDATLPDPLRQRETAPRTRNPQRAFVFKESWGTPFTAARES